jgi:hypothetical protein
MFDYFLFEIAALNRPRKENGFGRFHYDVMMSGWLQVPGEFLCQHIDLALWASNVAG